MARYNVAAALITLLIIGFHGITTCSATRIHIHKKASTNFIATKCGATAYPRLCVDTLSGHASTIQDNPSQLAQTAISVCLASARSTSAELSKLSTTGGLSTRDAGAVGDCKAIMGDSTAKLQESMESIGSLRGKKGMGRRINDIQTWLSTALTDVTMCKEGLDGSSMDDSVRTRIMNAERLTSIALALVNGLSSP